MRSAPYAAALVLSVTLATTSCAGSPPAPPLEPQCVSICVDSDTDPSCDVGVERCELRCSARVEGVSALCRACLLEGGARGGVPCSAGEVCCADPETYRNRVLDCAASCAGDEGAVPRDPDARCTALCDPVDAATCGEVRAQCFDDCQARIAGTTGLCATCLLEGAGVGGVPCSPGMLCCPDGLEFRTGVETCAPVCGR